MLEFFAAVSASVCIAPSASFAAESWGGSLAATSDYLVRGISRSDHDPAVQTDLHIAFDSGLIGGLFASTTRIASEEHRDVELSAFVGFVWAQRDPWRVRVMASHYTYPWNDEGSKYNYDELSIDAAYRDWLDINLVYSPNIPRYQPETGLIGVAETSVDINFHTPWLHRFAATAGVGLADVGGPDGTNYLYWSAGGVYDRAPWSFSVSYVGTNSAAQYLFYNAAAHSRLTATVIWQY